MSDSQSSDLKRLLIVYSPIDIDREHISTLCDGLVSQGFWAMAMPCYGPCAPDIRIFNLDGLPAPDTGLVQQLLAEIVGKETPCSGAVAIAESESAKP